MSLTFSGSDVEVIVRVPNEIAESLTEPFRNDLPGLVSVGRSWFLKLGNLQTLTVSSTRSIGPVRRLGESQPTYYTAGPRTVAGSMIFTTFNRNAFHQLFSYSIFENKRERFYVDMIPPLTIIVQVKNEYGEQAKQVISGARLVNFGTTFSIDDLYTEETYSYVASAMSPMIAAEDEAALYENLLRSVGPPSRTVGSTGRPSFEPLGPPSPRWYR